MIALDSPLQNLILTTRSNTPFIMNSTTFESWRKWKEHLQVLIFKIFSARDISIDGSPFKWFRNLRTLSITGNYKSFIHTLPNIMFQGLSNLQELHLNYLNIQVLSSGVLHTFSSFDTLKVLDLAHNLITEQDGLHEIWNILSLETVDLSYNKIETLLFNSTARDLPNLKKLYIDNQDVPKYLTGLVLYDLCRQAPYLNTVNAYNYIVRTFSPNHPICSHIISFHFSESACYMESTVYAPNLKRIYISNVRGRKISEAIKILSFFKTPQLRTADLSSNQISVIDEESAILLRNLTYLDLRNNELISLATLQHLPKIEILLLSGNKITVVPKPFLSNTASLTNLDTHDNTLVCDCSVQDFKDWILTDTVVYLWNNASTGTRYTCAAPESEKDVSVTEVELDCESPLLKIALISITCVIVITVAAGLVGRYRWHIKYKLFLLFNRRRYQNYLINNDDAHEDDENEDGLPRYDAYVISSTR